ncbi:fasciclin-like arabinogalactan protein 1 [Malania oleifera]|uniref:fasciclin-like arabinogalactan protein 1 n=1 Tax=Malania oleifera TaxID=397392 RepID=UPI0025ADECE5|nr:fasciclin-like arabinogalactan protein 1 [Malania oleifera]
MRGACPIWQQIIPGPLLLTEATRLSAPLSSPISAQTAQTTFSFSLPLSLSLSLSLTRHAMQLISAAGVAAGTVLFLLFAAASMTEAHNITRILGPHPEFSTFNHYLSLTHLAAEINSRETITVCAIDNAAMSDLLAKHYTLSTIKNVLSLHILLDYFGTKKIHQITNGSALAATMYQTTGNAPGSSGFVNITDLKGGRVGLGSANNDGNLTSTFVKSLDEIPYNISVIQISHILSSPAAEAPTPSPSHQNITAIMSAHGCKVFADTLLANPDAEKTFNDGIDGGLTIFCPIDDVFKKFLPKYKNLTADGKLSLLLFHGVPVYQSLAMLKSNNGIMNTLATDGANKYDFTVQNDGQDVTLRTKIVTAKLTGTLLDDQPLAIYTVDKVLLPKELFKAEVPAPAPAPEAESPKKSPKKLPKKASPPSPPSDSDSPDLAPSDDAADQTADNNGAVRFIGARFGSVMGLSLWLVLLNLM